MLPILNLTEILQAISGTNKCIGCTNRDTLLAFILFKQDYRVNAAQYDSMCLSLRWEWDEDIFTHNAILHNGGGSCDCWPAVHDSWQVHSHEAGEQLFRGQNAGDRLHYIMHTCDSGSFHTLVWMWEKREIHKQMEKNAGETELNEM